MVSPMCHIILLGDSIFDNSSYVEHGQPAVIDQLKAKIKDSSWNATLIAVDGDVLSGIVDQIKRIPHDATHLVISIGKFCFFFFDIKLYALIFLFRWK